MKQLNITDLLSYLLQILYSNDAIMLVFIRNCRITNLVHSVYFNLAIWKPEQRCWCHYFILATEFGKKNNFQPNFLHWFHDDSVYLVIFVTLSGRICSKYPQVPYILYLIVMVFCANSSTNKLHKKWATSRSLFVVTYYHTYFSNYIKSK